MLNVTSKANLSNIIPNLCSSYPHQIPNTFPSNHHTTHYLDLSLSLNHFNNRYHIAHYHIYQKPHYKYMYPHFSSNHPHHIFAVIIKTETIRYSRLSQRRTIDNFNFIHHHFTLSLGSFSIDDGDSTKNVTFKMNLCFFKLCRVYSNWLKMSNVGKFPWSWNLGEPHSSLERERKICHRLFTSSITHAIRHFHVVVMQWQQRNVQKSMIHVQICSFA